MYSKLEMYAYAEGYHDGRNAYSVDNYYRAEGNETCAELYNEGYINGTTDRNEQDERN